MRTIPLTRGLFAMVDDADFAWASQWKWCAHVTHRGLRQYAVRRRANDEAPGLPRVVPLHRALMGEPAADVDHRDGNGLNCQRANLRTATRLQNSRNQTHRRLGKTSRFKGVSRYLTRRWRATIKPGPDVPRLHLGYFDDERSAALAYDAAARLHFGEFAAPNFPQESP